MTPFPVSILRTVAIAAQGLQQPLGAAAAPPDRERLLQAIRQVGCVQIDTLQVVRRSQYLVLWSRLGSYNPEDLDNLQKGEGRMLFEGWQHAACLIPLEEYRYQIPHQRFLRENPANWYTRWLTEKGNPQVIDHVRQRIRREGALKVSDFEHEGQKGGTWWNWRPAKVALEYLYAFGELMIAGRDKFQRIYDLTERVLPAWVDRREPEAGERDRFWVERGARSMGVGLARHAGDFTWMKVTRSRPITTSLTEQQVLVPVTARFEDKSTAEFFIQRDNLSLLEQAADGALRAERTTFLSPFDSLWWAARRDEMLWGFHQALECYLPAGKRVYGYFSLPILHKDRLVGRFDPKLERKTGLLRIKSLYLEPGVKVTEELLSGVARAMQDFMHFHQASELIIEKSQPAAFGKKLLASLA